MFPLDTMREFHNLGCQDEMTVALAYRVYENLQRSKKYSNLDKIFNTDLDIIYIIATSDEKTHIFIPSLITKELNMYRLERIQKKMEEIHRGSFLHLAICDSSSNVLYYTITSGFEDSSKNWQKK